MTLLLNFLVSFLKILYGYHMASVSVLSDGFHSLFDGMSNVVGMLGIYISGRPPDETHPYGHRKYETVLALFVSVLLFFVCLEVLKGSYRSLRGELIPDVKAGAFVLMAVTISINLFVTRFETRKGKELNSEYLLADAMHTRVDVYMSLAVVIALIFCRMGFSLVDGIVGLGVGLLAVRGGLLILKETVGTLVDTRQLPDGLVKRIVTRVEGVEDCHEVRTRGTKDHIFVDLHVLVDPSLSVDEAHRIADNVEATIKKEVPEVRDVIVHIEPQKKADDG